MPTQFIFDRKLKEEQDTIAEVLRLTKKEPYPTKETVHLARFVSSCFYVIEDVKRKEEERKRELLRKKRAEEAEAQRKSQEEARRKELESLAPSPATSKDEPPLLDVPEVPTLQELGLEEIPNPQQKPTLEKREYVLQIYENPIGILVEKENNIYSYKVVEPYLEKNTLQKIKDMYEKEFQRDTSLLNNPSFLKKVAEKVSNKLSIPYSDMLPKKIQYYMERDLLGAGVFDPFLYDEKVKTILCEGPNKTLKVEYADLGMMETNLSIEKNDDLNRFMKRIGQTMGKTINDSSPLLEGAFQGLKFEGIMGIGGANSKLIIRRLS